MSTPSSACNAGVPEQVSVGLDAEVSLDRRGLNHAGKAGRPAV